MLITANSAVRCRVCKSNSTSFICSTHNEHSETDSLLNYRCNTCGSVFVANEIGNAELSLAYRSIDSTAYFKDTLRENTAKALYSINDLQNLASHDSTIIDIGAGSGLFLQLLHSHGYRNLFAHEICSEAEFPLIDIVTQFYSDADYRALPSDLFDVVTMLDVLEHVPDPQYLIKQCNRILHKGGIVYGHTPVVTSIDRLMHRVSRSTFVSRFGNSWQRARTSIFHLQNFTQQSLSILFEREGFVIKHLNIRNELSWPIKKYVQVYACEKNGMPKWLVPLVVPVAYIAVGTILNKNKAIFVAEKI